jgi:hypothetical protein
LSGILLTGKEKPKFKALWAVDSFDVSHLDNLTDEELYKVFDDQRKAFYSGKSAYYYPNGMQYDKIVKKNLIVNGFYENVLKTIGDLDFGGNDTKAQYIAVGTNAAASTLGMTQLGNEIARLQIPATNKFFSGLTLELAVFFNRNQGNCFSAEYITSVVETSTESVFQVDDSTGFVIGDRIRVTNENQFDFVTITDINYGLNNITVEPALTVQAELGDQVVQCWVEAGVFANNTATSMPNTGTMFNRLAPQGGSALNYVKDNTKITTLRMRFIGVP